MLARSLKHSWLRHFVVGMLALVFVPLSGPVFFCKCNGQVVTVSQLQPSAECCAAHCQDEPDPIEATSGCSKDPTSPCNEEIELVFARPDGAAGQLTAAVPLPLEAFVPGDLMPDLAQAGAHLRVRSFDYHPPPGAGRLHLHFQILLI